jgi:PAS domain S-box-containing protein
MVIHTDMAHAIQAPPAALQPGESISFEASASELRELVGSVPQFLWIYDGDGCCTFLSEQWMRYTGTAAGSQLGSRWLECIHPEERTTVWERWSRAISTGVALDIEMRVRAADGRYRCFKHRAVPKRADGVALKWFGTSTDINNLKDALRSKDDFFALAAHELRNPLVPIAHALKVLERSDTNPKTRRAMQQKIRRQLSHLIRLTEDLVDVARMAVGKLELQKSPIEVHQLVRNALEVAQPLMDEKGQEVLQRIPDSPLWLSGDGVRLVQALSNVLSNAAKYSPPGATITLSVTPLREGRLRIAVRDTGSGLTKDDLARIFDLFEQVNEGSRRADGLGVGLSLTKRFVELHGGTITAESEGPNRGSTFTMELPTTDFLSPAEAPSLARCVTQSQEK